MHVATTQVAAESASVSPLGLALFALQGQGGWTRWWIHQGQQGDPPHLVFLEAVFAEVHVLLAGWQQCHSVYMYAYTHM